ncbi:DUF3887 domain-containing protein [Selenomonas sp. F0473]|uniref:DUF3887 domain-containing protein n=1 Tax=Selenomonas sp. F0473 TaxID=999423 RepID=UPI00029E38BC|nr:DUF3887 domain-containing protein [Selenomonas sp. F0473]EKU70879.1 hypothetical protein HMPREF9161_01428 [Selenomonas sp. F0473]
MKIRRIVCALCIGLMVGGTAAAPTAFAEEQAAAQQAAPAVTQISLEESGVFNAQKVEEQMKATIDLFERGDIAALQASATDNMRQSLTAEQVNEAKTQFAPKWGARVSFGKPYMTALRQGDEVFAVGEIAVGYKATAVVYRLSYDRNMKLAGFFVR